MQNPKIKLFYILTVKTIKDIYIMNEKSGVDYFCFKCGTSLLSLCLLFVACCFVVVFVVFFNRNVNISVSKG